MIDGMGPSAPGVSPRGDALEKSRYRYPKHGDKSEVRRRIMGFGLGFEKIFKTTSIKLPVSAYTVYVELHLVHNDVRHARYFNGLHTVHDLTKWVFEVAKVPIDAYDLSYAEPGKAKMDDKLRLLTTQDSLDTRSLASMRAVHGVSKGIPGVHSIDDLGVTRLYLRLKCRTCGELFNNLQTCRRHITPVEEVMAVEDCWYRPVKDKKCLVNTDGYELLEAARYTGKGSSEIAQIHISMDEWPTAKLRLAKSVLLPDIDFLGGREGASNGAGAVP